MSITTIINCNGKDCKNELKYPLPFFACKAKMKEEGWKTKKINDEWQHFCKECKE